MPRSLAILVLLASAVCADVPPLSSWDSGAVVTWLRSIGLRPYLAQGAGLTGKQIAEGGARHVVNTLNITNPVHIKKVEAHVTSLMGYCPCNVPEVTSAMRVVTLYRREVFTYAFAVSESSRMFVLAWYFFGPEWDDVVHPHGSEVFSRSHRPANFSSRSLLADTDAGPTSFVVKMCGLLVPEGVLAWATWPFWWTNWIAVALYWFVLAVTFVRDLNDLVGMGGLYYDVQNSDNKMEVVLGFVKNYFYVLGINMLIIGAVTTVCYLCAEYVLPVWLQLAMIAAYFMLQVFWNVMSCVGFVMEVQEGPEGAEPEAAAGEGAAGDSTKTD